MTEKDDDQEACATPKAAGLLQAQLYKLPLATWVRAHTHTDCCKFSLWFYQAEPKQLVHEPDTPPTPLNKRGAVGPLPTAPYIIQGIAQSKLRSPAKQVPPHSDIIVNQQCVSLHSYPHESHDASFATSADTSIALIQQLPYPRRC